MTVAAVERGSSFERVLDALDQAGSAVHRSGTHKATAQCPVPAHEDREASLSIGWSNGKTLLHCFAGCTGERPRTDPTPVLEALGLAREDMFDEPPKKPRDGSPRRRREAPRPAGSGKKPRAAARKKKEDELGKALGPWRVVAEYVYVDEDGNPVGKVVREQREHERGYAKRFWQWHYIGHCTDDPCTYKRGRLQVVHQDGWGKNAPALRLLYRLPEVRAAIDTGHEVWLPEGEKDADALAGHFKRGGIKAAATTNASGATSWRPEYTRALAGAHVVIVEDRDPPRIDTATGEVKDSAGRQRTRMLLAELAGVAASVRVVQAAEGKDAFDHLTAGHAAGDFVPLTVSPAPDPDTDAAAAGQDPERNRKLERRLAAAEGTDNWFQALAEATGTEITGRADEAVDGDPDGQAERHLRVVRDGEPDGGDGDGGAGGGGGTGGPLDNGRPNDRTRYRLRRGELVRVNETRHGTFYDVVLGCDAQIAEVEQKVLDEADSPVTTGYLLELRHPGHPDDVREIRVSRKSWDSGEWLHDLPWTGVTYDSSRNGIAKVRDAIRMTSPASVPTVVHGAPGWIRGQDGQWMYVHGGGALGKDGPVDGVTVDLPPQLEQYVLPSPPETAEELCAAADHSVGMLAELPARIGAPLAGTTYRSAIGRMPSPLTCIGPPGSLKTSMAKAALHHFAPDLPYDISVLSLTERGATANAGAKLMHTVRDTLLLADDANPDRSLRQAAERVASIVRMQYNGESRDRLNRDGDFASRPTPPRGSLIVSAEVGPSAASATQRTLLVPFAPGLISRDTWVSLWEPESRQGRAATMASFIAWQASRREEILERVRTLTAEYSQAWVEAGHTERTAEALAHMAVGWRLMLDHLADRGAFSAGECALLWERAWAGLHEAGRTQNDPDEPTDAAGKILGRLRTGLQGRYGHLTTQAGAAPDADEATRYGWSADVKPVRGGIPGETYTEVTRPHGSDPVGCYTDVNGERRLWLVPELALIMLRKVGSALGEPFEETVKSVSSALHEANIGLATTTVKSTGLLRRSAQRSMPGSSSWVARPWVWDIPESALYPDAGGDTPPETPAPPPWDPDPNPGPGGGSSPDVGDDSPARDGEDAAAGPAEEAPCQDSPAGSNHPGEAVDGRLEEVMARPHSKTFISAGDLARMAGEDGLLPVFDLAQLRTLYIQVRRLEAPQPCGSCGKPSADLVGDTVIHLACPDPQAAEAEPAADGEPGAADEAQAPEPETQPETAKETVPAPAEKKTAAAGPATATQKRLDPELSGTRWRAPAAVVDVSGIYLPGGEVLRLPENLAHAGMLADWPKKLQLGWGGAKLPPHTGQLWLTRAFCEKIGLPVPEPGCRIAKMKELLAEAAQHPWITSATEAGWSISEASKKKLGHRMRIWHPASNKAGAQLLFLPYVTGDVSLLNGNPDPAALAHRLEQYAQHVGVPYGRSAAYSGHELIRRLDVNRKIVLSAPAAPAPVTSPVSGIFSFQRPVAPEEKKFRFLHTFDATAAWLAATARTKLGVGEPVHREHGGEFDPKLPGLWRVTPPEWDLRLLQDPFRAVRGEDGTIWLWTPLVAFANEILGANLVPVEAWVWPEHTQYLDKFAARLDGARQALAGPPPLYRPEDPDQAAVLAAVKDTYSSAVTLFGSKQIAGDPKENRAPDILYRPDWTGMILATAGARLYRKIFAAAGQTGGRYPVAVDRDNLAYLSDEADPARACPPGLVPAKAGQDRPSLGNGLGQVKNKGSAVVTPELAGRLAHGRFNFDTDLIPPQDWDPVHGGQQRKDDDRG